MAQSHAQYGGNRGPILVTALIMAFQPILHHRHSSHRSGHPAAETRRDQDMYSPIWDILLAGMGKNSPHGQIKPHFENCILLMHIYILAFYAKNLR